MKKENTTSHREHTEVFSRIKQRVSVVCSQMDIRKANELDG